MQARYRLDLADRFAVSSATARRFAANPSDPTSRWAPCPAQSDRSWHSTHQQLTLDRQQALIPAVSQPGAHLPLPWSITCMLSPFSDLPAPGEALPPPLATDPAWGRSDWTSTSQQHGQPGAHYDPLRLPLDRPPHFPGSPVIGGHRFPPPTVAGPRRLSRVPRTTIRTFNAQYAGGFLSARSWNKSAFHGLRRRLTGSAPSPPAHRRSLDDACSGFTHVADRTVAHAPLRTRPLDHARGHHYRGPRRLPGPDSHRQAILNLSLLHHVALLFLMAPEQSRRTRRKRQCATGCGRAAPTTRKR